MFERAPDWQAKLHEAVDMARAIPFQYGVHDCCLWAAYCVDRMCGTYIVREAVSRFNYHDKDAADAVIEAGGGMVKLLSSFFGEPIAGALAAPGDVVLAEGPDGVMLAGVVVGHQIMSTGPSGVVALPHSSARIGWRI